MTGPGWVFFVIGWIASNLVIKLLLDSIEKIYRVEIDATVKQLPRKIKDMSTGLALTGRNRLLIVLLETIRILAMVFFVPLFLVLTLVPLLRGIQYFRTQYRFVQTLFSRDWMEFALVLTEAFSWKGLLFCILGFFRVNGVDQTNTDSVS